MQKALDLGGLLVDRGNRVLLGLFAVLDDVVVLLAKLQNKINFELLYKHTHNSIRQ